MRQSVEQTMADSVAMALQFYHEELWSNDSLENRRIAGTCFAIADKLVRKMDEWGYATEIMKATYGESLPTGYPVEQLPQQFQDAVYYTESK